MGSIYHSVEEAIVPVSNLWISRYTTIAGLCVVLYDCIISIGQEVELVWKAPKRPFVHWAYLANKYGSAAFMIAATYHISNLRPPLDTNFCRIFVPTMTMAQVVTEVLAKWILTLRVVALVNVGAGRRWIVWMTYGLYVSSYAICIGFSFWSAQYNYRHVFYEPLTNICAVGASPPLLAAIFIPPLVYETYMVVITIREAFIHAHALRHAENAPILHTVFRDGIAYFIGVLALRIMMICLAISQGSVYLGLNLQWALVTVLVSRFFLNLKAVMTQSTWLRSSRPTAKHPPTSLFEAVPGSPPQRRHNETTLWENDIDLVPITPPSGGRFETESLLTMVPRTASTSHSRAPSNSHALDL